MPRARNVDATLTQRRHYVNATSTQPTFCGAQRARRYRDTKRFEFLRCVLRNVSRGTLRATKRCLPQNVGSRSLHSLYFPRGGMDFAKPKFIAPFFVAVTPPFLAAPYQPLVPAATHEFLANAKIRLALRNVDATSTLRSRNVHATFTQRARRHRFFIEFFIRCKNPLIRKIQNACHVHATWTPR
jgi:hypothetical protein